MPPPPPPPPLAHKTSAREEEDKKLLIYEEIIATAPMTDKKKLVKLISRMEPLGLGWDTKRQLTLHGEPIEGSDVKIILQGHVTRGKQKQKLAKSDVGYDFFMHQLLVGKEAPIADVLDSDAVMTSGDNDPPWFSLAEP